MKDRKRAKEQKSTSNRESDKKRAYETNKNNGNFEGVTGRTTLKHRLLPSRNNDTQPQQQTNKQTNIPHVIVPARRHDAVEVVEAEGKSHLVLGLHHERVGLRVFVQRLV
jgi:hypothetical protein